MTVDVPDVNAAAGPSDSRWPLSRTQTAEAAKAAEEPVLGTRHPREARRECPLSVPGVLGGRECDGDCAYPGGK
jgi:hypothetical protein